MVLAYHVILSFYGFWLPNDPRGSWSDFVASWELFRYGPATKVSTHLSVAHVPHDRRKRLEAKKALNYSPVILNGAQARSVAYGFREASTEGAYAVHAVSVLPDHVHLIIGRNARPIGQIVAHLKGRATQRLRHDGHDPMSEYKNRNGEAPSPWAEMYWKVFVDSQKWMRAAINYVEENPLKEGKPRQSWSFVQPYGET